MPDLNVKLTADSKQLESTYDRVVQRTKTLRAQIAVDQERTRSLSQAYHPDFLNKPGFFDSVGKAGQKAGGNFMTRFLDSMKGTGSGGVSQMISVVSNTMSSLASGMSPTRILAQQLPNLLQSFTLIGQSVIKFIFNPITLAVTAGLALVAGAGYAIYRHFSLLAKNIENVSNRMGLARASTAQLNDVMASARDLTLSHAAAMSKLADKTLTVKERTDELLESLREKHGWEMKMATAKGASPKQLAEMEVQQAKAELAIINQAITDQKAANTKNEADAKSLQAKIKAESRNETGDFGLLKVAQESATTAAANRDAVIKKLGPDFQALLNRQRTEGDNAEYQYQKPVPGGIGGMGPGGFAETVTTTVGAELEKLKNMVVTTEGGFKTLNQATLEWRGANEKVADLTESTAKLTDSLKQKQAAVEEGTRNEDSLNKQRKKIEQELGYQSEYGPQLAAMTGGGARADLTANQRIGAYAMPGQLSMMDIAKKQLQATNTTNTKLDEVKSAVAGNNVNASFPGN